MNMQNSILLLNIFVIVSTAMYANAEYLHNYLAGSNQTVMKISDNLRVGKINIIRSHNQDINQSKSVFAKTMQTENTGKDITNIFFKFPYLKKLFKNFKFPTPPPILSLPRSCPRGQIWISDKCVPFKW